MNVNYQDLISVGNLFQAWNEFKKGKKQRKDVQTFERSLEDNLFNLHQSLKNKSYKHGHYQSFYVQDPKQRHIHKAEVKDRVVHNLVYKYLYELFDKTFIFDAYSCRLNKGTHKGVKRLAKFVRIISRNYTQPCWALKLDIKKFFASVDHQILLELLEKKIKDQDVLWLLKLIIGSFRSESDKGKGIPLGNLTSQIFANIYLNELDQYIKQQLQVRFYLRYADDFLILKDDKNYLNDLIKLVEQFLSTQLNLQLHPKKIILRKLIWGIDFLGYIVLPHYILPRTKTKKRVFKKLAENLNRENFSQTLASYLGYLSHSNSYKLQQRLLDIKVKN